MNTAALRTKSSSSVHQGKTAGVTGKGGEEIAKADPGQKSTTEKIGQEVQAEAQKGIAKPFAGDDHEKPGEDVRRAAARRITSIEPGKKTEIAVVDEVSPELAAQLRQGLSARQVVPPKQESHAIKEDAAPAETLNHFADPAYADPAYADPAYANPAFAKAAPAPATLASPGPATTAPAQVQKSPAKTTTTTSLAAALAKATASLPRRIKLSKPVGTDCTPPKGNLPKDVDVVQRFLLSRGYLKNGKYQSGKMDAATVAAIKDFQSEIVGSRKPDGRIDLGGRTLKNINYSLYRTSKKVFGTSPRAQSRYRTSTLKLARRIAPTVAFSGKRAVDMTAAEAQAWLKKEGINFKKLPRNKFNSKIKTPVELPLAQLGVDFRMHYTARGGKKKSLVNKSLKMDARMAVALVRLSRRLKKKGVTTIHHSGLSQSPKGQHGKGIAIDIHGFDRRTATGVETIMMNSWRTGRSSTKAGLNTQLTGAIKQTKEEKTFMSKQEKFLRWVWGAMINNGNNVVTPAHNTMHHNHFHFGL